MTEQRKTIASMTKATVREKNPAYRKLTLLGLSLKIGSVDLDLLRSSA